MPQKLTTLLLMPLAFLSISFVSTNVPLDHWSYEAVDKLIGQRLVDSGMMTTRPLSRLEMARLIAEASERIDDSGEDNEIIPAILDRLTFEFAEELRALGTLDGVAAENFLKPLEDPYLKFLYSDKKPDIENIRGDEFDKHSNLRAGFASRAKFADTVAFYVHPEYRYSTDNPGRDVKLIAGYAKVALGKLEVELGKDSLWWGPGYHGSLLMSNNAEPFKMVKLSNPRPIKLPWIFRSLGPFKAVWFLTELEEDRTIPEARLTGMRVNFKPHPAFELGLSRAIMFAGQGRGGLGLRDYLDIFLATKENRPGKLDNNQLAGFDASVILPLEWLIPVKSVKVYTDWIGEDEAGGLPSTWGKLFGAQFYDIGRTGRTDLQIEYADNHVAEKPNVFYNHHIYGSGYTYRGRIIGHNMGTDSRDLYVRLSHYLSKDLILGLAYDRQTGSLSSSPKSRVEYVEADLTIFGRNNCRLKSGYRYTNTTSSSTQDNQFFFLQLTYDF